MDNHHILGIDVGASGIKGAIIDVNSGALLTERLKLNTPTPATPEAIINTIDTLVKEHKWNGIIGCGFPSIIKNGVAHSAANIDESCIGVDFSELISQKTGMPAHILNDADAAGLAEIKFGNGKDQKGVVIMITIGSGLGSAIFTEGILVPNTELGHLYLKDMGIVAEKFASSAVKKSADLPWEVWGPRLNRYLIHLCRIFSPDTIILGGGISKKYDRFEAFLDPPVSRLTPAHFLNNAGSIGAAYYAACQKDK